MDARRGIGFVEENGTPLEKARLMRILYDAEPEPEVVQSFLELQNRDGGFPFDLVAGRLSTVDNTLSALWWLDELGMLQSPSAQRAFAYLLAAQGDDGGWDEAPAIAQYELPPWVRPGDLRTRLYLSAYAAYWLAVGGYRTHPAFRRALEYLLLHRDEAGKFHGYLHTTWIATGAFALAGEQYSDIVSKGLEVLAGWPLPEWQDSQIAWALDCLGRAGVPESHPFAASCREELMKRQGTEGSWSSEDGKAFAVGATIAALKVLR